MELAIKNIKYGDGDEREEESDKDHCNSSELAVPAIPVHLKGSRSTTGNNLDR